MIKTLLLFLLVSFSSISTFGQKKYEKALTKTWQEDNGFAGTLIVFAKTDKDKLVAFRQTEGSGLPVLSTEVFNVEIRQDTIFILTSVEKNRKQLSYTFTDNQVLLKNGKALKLILREPQIQLFTTDNKIIGEPINVSEITRYELENKIVYVNEKPYMLDPIHN